jgi:hypothetical protein
MAAREIVPALAATEKSTAPSPLPLLPAAMVIQGDGLAAVQTHPPGALTLTLPYPPAEVKAWLGWESAKEQLELLPAWETAKDWPAMVRAPVRVPVVVLGDTEYCTVAIPLAWLPEVTVIHAALLAAVQEQPPEAFTTTLPAPPMALKD